MLVSEQVVNFRGLHGFASCTRARVYNDKGQWVVVVTETEFDNPGTSVTNSWGNLVDLGSQLLHLLPADVDREQIVWIEHYSRYPESYDRVYMDWDGKKYSLIDTIHPWRRLEKEELRLLLGMNVD